MLLIHVGLGCVSSQTAGKQSLGQGCRGCWLWSEASVFLLPVRCGAGVSLCFLSIVTVNPAGLRLPW